MRFDVLEDIDIVPPELADAFPPRIVIFFNVMVRLFTEINVQTGYVDDPGVVTFKVMSVPLPAVLSPLMVKDFVVGYVRVDETVATSFPALKLNKIVSPSTASERA